MALDSDEAAVVKGLIATGKHRQSDIAAYYSVNSARIAEINTGMKFSHVKPAPAHLLPRIREKPTSRAILKGNGRYKDHCTDRDRAINGVIDGLYGNLQGFKVRLRRIRRKYALNSEERQSIIQTLQQTALQYQLLSQDIEV